LATIWGFGSLFSSKCFLTISSKKCFLPLTSNISLNFTPVNRRAWSANHFPAKFWPAINLFKTTLTPLTANLSVTILMELLINSIWTMLHRCFAATLWKLSNCRIQSLRNTSGLWYQRELDKCSHFTNYSPIKWNYRSRMLIKQTKNNKLKKKRRKRKRRLFKNKKKPNKPSLIRFSLWCEK
jgi:hypothetical protein